MRHEAVIGQTFAINGNINCNQDLIIEGRVDGQTIDVGNNTLTIGIEGVINGDLKGDYVIIMGQVKGNVSATQLVELRASATLDGDIRSPRSHLEDGCTINGRIFKT